MIPQTIHATHTAPQCLPHRMRGVWLVLCCTVLGAAAQVLMKTGANALATVGIGGVITSVPLMSGCFLYGISTVLLVLALREGELSRLYPIIALTYVWVTILSVVVFQEAISHFKIVGVTAIVAGVCVLGGRK